MGCQLPVFWWSIERNVVTAQKSFKPTVNFIDKIFITRILQLEKGFKGKIKNNFDKLTKKYCYLRFW